MRQKVAWVDYLVLATGTSRRQIATMADEIERALAQLGDHKVGIEGYDHGSWVVLDFADVVVHLFNVEKRAYYQLEHLWADADLVSWEPSDRDGRSPGPHAAEEPSLDQETTALLGNDGSRDPGSPDGSLDWSATFSEA